MTKTQFVEQLAQALGQSKSESERTLESVLSTLKDALQKGEKLDLRGFGVFKIRQTKARQARNPRSGEMVAVPAKTVAVFKPSKDFAALLNKDAKEAEAPSAS
jgi:nucleoid DNA-binding protein